jgi:hypothetical protein
VNVDLDAPVFLLGMPRSGTTWLSQIFESAPEVIVRLSPPYSYKFRDQLNTSSGREEWHRVLEGAIRSDDKFLTQDWRRETGELSVFARDPAKVTRLAVKDTRFHDLYRAGMELLPRAKTVCIVRHPAAALWSWRSCKEFPKGADFRAEWRTGKCRKSEGPGEYWGYDDWRRLTLAFRKAEAAAPERTLVVRYEAMVAEAAETVRRILAFAGVNFLSETRDFIARSQQTHDSRPYSVFKDSSRVNAWREAFPAEILEEIETETHAAGLAEYLK